jgi:hypothetical protein
LYLASQDGRLGVRTERHPRFGFVGMDLHAERTLRGVDELDRQGETTFRRECTAPWTQQGLALNGAHLAEPAPGK